MRPGMYRLQGPWAWLAFALAGVVGLFLAFWLVTSLWIFAMIGGAIGLAAYGWQRLRLRFGGGWRRVRPRWLPPPWR